MATGNISTMPSIKIFRGWRKNISALTVMPTTCQARMKKCSFQWSWNNAKRLASFVRRMNVLFICTFSGKIRSAVVIWVKIDHEFCQLGIYRKNLLFIPKNTGILSDFSLIMGIADPFLLYIPKTQENQGVLWVYCCSFFAICPICDISISYDVRCTLPVIMLWKTIEPQYYNGGSMNMNIKRNFLHWIIYDRHTLSEQRCRFRNHQRRDPLSEIIWI